MNFIPHNIYHVYNQGNNRQIIFRQREDYLVFLGLYKHLFPQIASTIAWCLMPNHFHFMLYTTEECTEKIKQGGILIDSVSNAIRKLLSGYARIFNNKYPRSGSVFRQRTRSKCLSDIVITPGSPTCIGDYLLNCFHYLHQNPVAAKLVACPEDWEFSSFRDYKGLRNGTLCCKELTALHCGYDPLNLTGKSNEMVEKKFIDSFR